MRSTRSRLSLGLGERGQSAVEFALILPLVLLLSLALIQVGAVVQAQIQVTHAAREAARALAIDPAADADEVVAVASTLNPDHTRVSVVFSDSGVAGRKLVAIEVTHEIEPAFPAIAAMVDQFTVRASATMLVEAR